MTIRKFIKIYLHYSLNLFCNVLQINILNIKLKLLFYYAKIISKLYLKQRWFNFYMLHRLASFLFSYMNIRKKECEKLNNFVVDVV